MTQKKTDTEQAQSKRNIPSVLTGALRETLSGLSTATLTHQLQKRGVENTFFSGLRPLDSASRMVGRARTLRYVAVRNDCAVKYSGGMNAQRRAVEGIEAGDVLIIEARGIMDAGTIGDIYALRSFVLGAAGIVTDGALRDTPAISGLGKPVYAKSGHAATFMRHHMPFSCDEPVTCAEVFVEPGDVIVGDGEGAVVIPHALAEEIARDGVVQELEEEFASERISAGESVRELFPLSDQMRSEFEAWAAEYKKK